MESDKALLRVTWLETHLIAGWLHSYWTQILAERTSHFCLQDTERKCWIFHQNYINLQAENNKFFSHSNYTIKKIKSLIPQHFRNFYITPFNLIKKKKIKSLIPQHFRNFYITPFSFKTNPVNMLWPLSLSLSLSLSSPPPTPPKKHLITLILLFVIN